MNSTKIRLVGGPFGGKVMEHPYPGSREIILRDKKRMTRKQQWEWIRDHQSDMVFLSKYPDPFKAAIRSSLPMVEARYRIAMHPHSPTMHDPFTGRSKAFMPAMHPDGSTFYEYVEGSRRDLTPTPRSATV